MNRLPAEMIDLFKRWERVEAHEVEQQTGESQPPSGGIMFQRRRSPDDSRGRFRLTTRTRR